MNFVIVQHLVSRARHTPPSQTLSRARLIQLVLALSGWAIYCCNNLFGHQPVSVIALIPPLSHLIPSPCSLLSQPQTLSLCTHADLQWPKYTLVDTEVYRSCAVPLRALQRWRVAMNRVCYMQVVYIYIYCNTQSWTHKFTSCRNDN